PVSTRQLLGRMVLLAVTAVALLELAVAGTWALAVQSDAAVAIAFAVGVACLQVAALGFYLSLVTVWWSVWQRISSMLAVAWVIVPASILMWQFRMLRTRPQNLASVAGIEAIASLIAVAAACLAIGRMVSTREPTSGI